MHLLKRLAVLVCSAAALVAPAARTARATRRRAEASDDGWETTLSGLSYFDEVVGDGPLAEPGCVATVAYEGRLASSGRMFDSSKGKGAFKFQVGEGVVIPGWDEGIATMRVGGKRKLRIPARLGYGEYGSGALIPPNADLEFDCELENVAEGTLAVLAAKASIGYNLRTVFLGLFLLSFAIPPLFPDVAWLH
mmetsp:Transcript_17060/g.50903  ORF Transcript_17060/g.50903 Transcript_17060/m.50903 type:complete len:193 (+) Transcript_17060:149-727(+)